MKPRGQGCAGEKPVAKSDKQKEDEMTINVSPYATNVLDLINIPLKDFDGREIIVRRQYMDFVIYIDGKEYNRTNDNLSASYMLNQLCVNYK